MSEELTLRQMKDLTWVPESPDSDSITIKGNLDYPTFLTEPKVLKKGSYSYEQLKELAKSLNVKVDLPTDFKKRPS